MTGRRLEHHWQLVQKGGSAALSADTGYLGWRLLGSNLGSRPLNEFVNSEPGIIFPIIPTSQMKKLRHMKLISVRYTELCLTCNILKSFSQHTCPEASLSGTVTVSAVGGRDDLSSQSSW